MFQVITPLESLSAPDPVPRSVPVLEAGPDESASGEPPGRQRCVADAVNPSLAARRVAEADPRVRAPLPAALRASLHARPPRLPRASRAIAAVASVVVATGLVGGIAAGMAFEDVGPPTTDASSMTA